MQEIPTVKENLGKYIDAGFPILYIRTDEETKADRYIAAAAGNREVLEWNGANGYVNFKTKVPFSPQGQSLEDKLTTIISMRKELDQKLLVIKDAAEQLNPDGQYKSDKVIALLKEIARKIRNGDIDATIIIVSSVLRIPHELEKLITVLELGFPDETEISQIMDQFTKKYDLPSVPTDFRSELTTAFKRMSESEIMDLLGLAISQDGELTRKTLKLIFNQKQQMVLTAGILEMVPLREKFQILAG